MSWFLSSNGLRLNLENVETYWPVLEGEKPRRIIYEIGGVQDYIEFDTRKDMENALSEMDKLIGVTTR